MAKKKQDKKQEKGRRAGWIAFGATALLYAAIFPLYRIGDFILAAALSFLVGKVVSIMGSGLDLTTHNKEDAAKKAQEVEELPLSGDDAADAMISRGQEMLHQIREENDAIPDQVLSGQMDELEQLCVQIFKTVAEKPAKAPQIRKFMDYYLPVTLKLVGAYEEFDSLSVQGDDIVEAKNEIEKTLDTINNAFGELLERLFRDTAFDVTTDAQVLQTMLAKDGLTKTSQFDKKINNSQEEAQ